MLLATAQLDDALALPSALIDAAVLASGDLALVCQGKAPDTVLFGVFAWPRPQPAEPIRAKHLVQLGGAGHGLIVANHHLEQALVMVHEPDSDQEASAFLYGVDGQRPLWRLGLERGPVSWPLCIGSQSIFVDPGVGLTGLSVDGHELWTANLGAAPCTNLVQNQPGQVAVGLADGQLCVVGTDGGEVCRWRLEGPARALASRGDGRLWSHDGQRLSLHHPDEPGARWSAALEAVGSGAMVVDAHGNAVVPHAHGGVIEVSADGQRQTRRLERWSIAHLTADASGAIIATSHDPQAQQPHGLVVWSLPHAPSDSRLANPYRLPERPIKLISRAHELTVIMESGRIQTFRIAPAG